VKACLIACIYVMGLVILQGCSLQESAKLSATDDSKCSKLHMGERYIGSHLYRHGRHIHHHPECNGANDKRLSPGR